MKTTTIRAWSWVHTWSSLVATAFLLMLCVTGLPLVFTHEIEEALLDRPWTPANAEGPLLTLDQVLATAQFECRLRTEQVQRVGAGAGRNAGE